MRFLSLCSGIEAASAAWIPLGWTCAAVAEIDKFPSAVLAHHYPDVPNLGNISLITRDQLTTVDSIDVVVFGFPCQDLSVAGKRAGLKGERSGLFFEAMRIVELCHELWGTRWTVVENVPGLFSSAQGEDFAAVVGTMVGAEFAVPKAKWQNTGVALGPRGLVEWAVLDAQWFGVPQRRRRVFLVRDSGDWRSRPPLLSFPESLSGDSPPRREKGQGAPTIPSRRSAGGGLGTDFDCDGGLVTSVSSVVREREKPAHSITCHQVKGGDPTTDNYVMTGGFFDQPAHSLRADGFDASEDGTGRGTPLVPVGSFQQNSMGGRGTLGWNDEGEAPLRPVKPQGDHQFICIQERAICENVDAGPDGVGVRVDGVAYTLEGRAVPQAVAFSCKDSGADCGELAPTLRSINFDQSHANAGGQVAVAFNLRGREGGSQPELADQASLRSASGGSSRSYVATSFTERTRKDGRNLEFQNDLSYSLNNPGAGGRSQERNVVTPTMAVRRLTPRECEALQGFPKNYTKIGEKTADGPRYKALGNSFAVPVVRWIGQRLQLIDLFS
jgi:DNA (cytosine-5)-methyltransferase 1